MSTSDWLEQYTLLITQYVAGDITASQFESSYLELFKNQVREMPTDVFGVLNSLFSDVDAYCGDTELQDEDDIDGHELLSSAKEALKKLGSMRDSQRGR